MRGHTDNRKGKSRPGEFLHSEVQFVSLKGVDVLGPVFQIFVKVVKLGVLRYMKLILRVSRLFLPVSLICCIYFNVGLSCPALRRLQCTL